MYMIQDIAVELAQSTQPYPLTRKEWKEIAAMQDVRDMWGITEDYTLQDISELIYAVKFNYMSGGPGYVGDLYILMGDSLQEPVILTRDRNKKLEVLE